MPERVQLSRRKSWRMPANTVSVARPHRWGNPFVIAEPITREDAVRMFRELVLDREAFIVTNPGSRWEVRNRFRDPVGRHRAPTVDEIRAELAGKNLACWCRLDSPCHADVLLEIANGGDGS